MEAGSPMILRFFEFTYLAFGAISLSAGVVALSRIFAGRPFEHWSIIFLKSALATSITGLLLDTHRSQPSHLATMLSVYVAGVGILAWRRFHLNRSWGLVFALSLMGVLCLELLAAVQHLFNWLSPLDASGHSPAKLLFFVAESAIASLFAAMGTFAVRRYWIKSIYH
jgi:hypothetical protein